MPLREKLKIIYPSHERHPCLRENPVSDPWQKSFVRENHLSVLWKHCFLWKSLYPSHENKWFYMKDWKSFIRFMKKIFLCENHFSDPWKHSFLYENHVSVPWKHAFQKENIFIRPMKTRGLTWKTENPLSVPWKIYFYMKFLSPTHENIHFYMKIYICPMHNTFF